MTEKIVTARKETTMTYAELKAQLDTFTPEQLAQKIRWWSDRHGGGVAERLDVFDEAFANVSGDGFEPITTYIDEPDIAKGIEDGEFPVLPRGTAILMVD